MDGAADAAAATRRLSTGAASPAAAPPPSPAGVSICADGQPDGGGGSGRSESAYERQVFRKGICLSWAGAMRWSVAWQPWWMAPSRSERVANTDSARFVS